MKRRRSASRKSCTRWRVCRQGRRLPGECPGPRSPIGFVRALKNSVDRNGWTTSTGNTAAGRSGRRRMTWTSYAGTNSVCVSSVLFLKPMALTPHAVPRMTSWGRRHHTVIHKAHLWRTLLFRISVLKVEDENDIKWEDLAWGWSSVRSPQWLRSKWWSIKRQVANHKEIPFSGMLLLTDASVTSLSNL